MNKKNILLFIFFSAGICLTAQEQRSHYPAVILSNELISAKVEELRKAGADASDIAEIKEGLTKKMLKQQTDFRNGVIEPEIKVNVPLIINSSACSNSDFENGTSSNWNFFYGDVTYSVLPCNSCPAAAGAITNVVTDTSTIAGQCTNGVDTYGSFPVVGSGNYSLLLNDASAGAKIMKATYTYAVDPSNAIYTFQYAAVLNSGGHTASANPYFHVDVTDVTAGTTIPCTVFDIIAPSTGTLPGWSISPLCGGSACNSVYYKPWTTVAIDLTSALGHTVAVSFIVSDCSNTGHFGYVYLDGSCGGDQITASNPLCAGGSTTLSGPSGFSGYSWAGPVSDTTQNLSTGIPGNYTLTATSPLACPSSVFYYNLTQSTSSSPVVSIQVTKDSICNGATDTLIAQGASTYTWSSNVSNSTNDTIYVSPGSSTSYTVVGTDTVSGCRDTSITLINVLGCTSGFNTSIVNSTDLLIYPNPANGNLTVECKFKNAELYIFDVLGNKMIQLHSEKETTNLDISSLSDGVYFVNVKTNEGIFTKKFIVQR